MSSSSSSSGVPSTLDDVSEWLEKLGFEEYVRPFKSNKIDGEALVLLKESDLVDLQVRALGDRRKLMKHIGILQQRSPNPSLEHVALLSSLVVQWSTYDPVGAESGQDKDSSREHKRNQKGNGKPVGAMLAAAFNALKYAPMSVLNIFLQSGLDAEVQHPHTGHTLLTMAASKGRTHCCNTLLDFGANVETADADGRTALMWASKKGHFEVAELLIDSGADVNRVDPTGFTALMHAAKRGHPSVCSVLMEHKADVEAKDGTEMTPLLWAAREGKSNTCQVLLNENMRHGRLQADINWVDKNGYSALLHAASRGRTGAVETLMKCHDIHAEGKDSHGNTALLVAAAADKPETVRVLLEEGVHLFAKNAHGDDALALAPHGKTRALLMERYKVARKSGSTVNGPHAPSVSTFDDKTMEKVALSKKKMSMSQVKSPTHRRTSSKSMSRRKREQEYIERIRARPSQEAKSPSADGGKSSASKRASRKKKRSSSRKSGVLRKAADEVNSWKTKSDQ